MSPEQAPGRDANSSSDGLPEEIEDLLRELLVGHRRVKVDPATGRVVPLEKPSLDRTPGRE